MEEELRSKQGDANFQDIAGHKLAEETLRNNEEKFRLAADFTYDWESWVDPKGNYIYVSPSCKRITGHGADEFYRDPQLLLKIVHPDDRAGYEYHIKNHCNPLDIGSIDFRIVMASGQTRWVSHLCQPVFGKSGEWLGRRATNRDITERKQADEALAFERSQLLSIFDSIDDVVYVTDPYTYEVLYANKAMKAKFGRELVRGVCYREFQHRDSPCDFCTNSIILKEKGKLYQWEYYNPTVDLYFLITDRIIRWPDGRDVRFEIAKDITERKRAEEKLRENHRFTTTLMGNLPGMVYRRRNVRQLTMEFLSSGCLKLTGYKIEDLFNDLKISFGQLIHPDDRARVWDETQVAVHANRPYTLTYRIITAGREEKWVWDQGRGIFKDNKLLLEGFVTDITERKRSEEALREAKAQAELYLDLMGHDINNMHQIALGYLEMAHDMHPEAGQGEFLDKPIEVLQRSAQLIRNVRKLQKLKEGLFQSHDVDVSGILADVQREFKAVPHKTITLNMNGCDHCHVRANELLHDVFANLVSNAIKHTGDRADINIGLDVVYDNGSRYCRVSVEDDGPGISDDFKGRIFHRMLRGDSNSKGIGLGLYLVKSLVESYGGRVWVEDRVQGDHRKGASFVVLLPAADQ